MMTKTLNLITDAPLQVVTIKSKCWMLPTLTIILDKAGYAGLLDCIERDSLGYAAGRAVWEDIEFSINCADPVGLFGCAVRNSRDLNVDCRYHNGQYRLYLW